MLYIVILNHQLSLVNEFVRIFYLLSSHESASNRFCSPSKVSWQIYLFTDVSNVHMNRNSKSAGNPFYFFLIFPTINNNNGRIKQIVKDNGVQAVAIKF